MAVVTLFFFLVLLQSLNGLPTRQDVRKRTLYNHDDQERQTQNSDCVTQTDCLPSNVNSTELIQCVQGTCICYPCFQLDTSSGRCNVSRCFSYHGNKCIDKRYSQKEAFLLSVFLSSFGVANFYIDDYTLALVQLSLTFALFLLCFCCCCFCCCIMKCEDDCFMCDLEDSCFPSLTLIMCVGVSFLLILTISCWWLIDLIIFGLNERSDGNGCMLRENL